MKEFLFIYRADYDIPAEDSPEEAQARDQNWIDWIAGIAAQNKLSSEGGYLELPAKILENNDTITDGPYTEIKENIMGYTVVKASSMDEAAELAKNCPIFSIGGTVEVREISFL